MAKQEDKKKFRAEIAGIRESVWTKNQLEYDTEKEVKDWLDGLAHRWTGYDLSRVVSTDTPIGQPIDLEKDIIYQNFR